MDNTINGRTPDEIKKGLECCIVGECSKCPYMHECDDHLAKGGDMLPADVVLADMHSLIQQLERERDAAVEQLKEMSGTPCENCERCRYCIHFGKCDYHFGRCNDCISMDCPCIGCVNGSNWQWLGVQEVE